MPKRFTSIFNIVSAVMVALLFSFHGEAALAQNTAFTYQGRLTDGGGPATVQYDLRFQIFAAPSGGTALGTVEKDNVPVTNGIFSVQLDFDDGNFNNNGAQFLEIGVRPFDQTGAYTPLTPRQQITSTPYAIKSRNAATADGLSGACVNCVTDSQISSVSGSQVSGLIPVASVPADSTNYIQNQTALLQAANFKINVGTANIFNATTQYNIGGNRVLGIAGFDNVFVGIGAGQVNTGFNNAFFGRDAGLVNAAGVANAYFGAFSGPASTGSFNSFFGQGSGGTNTTGSRNVFVGSLAGLGNISGSDNTFLGTQAGISNMDGASNLFVGKRAGPNNTTGSANTFLGAGSGSSNTIEHSNTFIGNLADGAAGIINATSIGSQASVTRSNSLVLGRISAPGTNVGIGTSSPQYRMHVVGENVRVENDSFPRFSLNFTSGNPDEKRWQNYAAPIALVFSALNDVEMGETKWLQVNRGTGTAISSVVFPSSGIQVNGSVSGVGPYQDVSDLRYKRNIQPISDALDRVLRLRGVSYDWRQEEFPEMNFAKGRKVGFIAQEVEPVFPEAVAKDDRGFYTVAYASVTPLLVEAIKQQQKTVEQLKQENIALHEESVALRERVAALEQSMKKLIEKP